jgi:hypothetical protein
MAYRYEEERPKLFTDEGQRTFLKVRDNAHIKLKQSGAATLGKIIEGSSADTFVLLACVDRLLELGEIREVTRENCLTQDRVYVGTGKLGA